MASDFDEQYTDGAADAHLDVFGEAVDYTPHGGALTPVTGMFEPGRVLDEYLPQGDEQELEAGVLVLAPSAIASPSLRDKAAIASTGAGTWAVAMIGQRLPMLELQMVRRTRRRLGGSTNVRER